MTRTIDRSYIFDRREVREALLAALKAKGLPCPGYIGDTDTCTWRETMDGCTEVRWTEVDKVEMP